MGAYFERRSKRKDVPLTLQFEGEVQILELICDERAIQRDVWRQVVMSYIARNLGVGNKRHPGFISAHKYGAAKSSI
jgi:hypothetical protein